MSDTPVPPSAKQPVVPIHLVRRSTLVEQKQREELAKLRAELEAERALVCILRNQPVYRDERAQEPTLPGIGVIARQQPALRKAKLVRRARRTGKWVLLGTALGLAAQLASLLYPRLVGPIQAAQHLYDQLSGALQ